MKRNTVRSRMNKGIALTALLVLVAVMLFSQAGWEGNAMAGTRAEFSSPGLFAVTNAFAAGTRVNIVNLDNGRTLEVRVLGRVGRPGIFMVLSPEAAAQLGVDLTVPARVLVRPLVAISDQSLFEQPLHPDPDLNPTFTAPDRSLVAPEETQISEEPQTPEEPQAPEESRAPLVSRQIEPPFVAPTVPPFTTATPPVPPFATPPVPTFATPTVPPSTPAPPRDERPRSVVPEPSEPTPIERQRLAPQPPAPALPSPVYPTPQQPIEQPITTTRPAARAPAASGIGRSLDDITDRLQSQQQSPSPIAQSPVSEGFDDIRRRLGEQLPAPRPLGDAIPEADALPPAAAPEVPAEGATTRETSLPSVPQPLIPLASPNLPLPSVAAPIAELRPADESVTPPDPEEEEQDEPAIRSPLLDPSRTPRGPFPRPALPIQPRPTGPVLREPSVERRGIIANDGRQLPFIEPLPSRRDDSSVLDFSSERRFTPEGTGRVPFVQPVPDGRDVFTLEPAERRPPQPPEPVERSTAPDVPPAPVEVEPPGQLDLSVRPPIPEQPRPEEPRPEQPARPQEPTPPPASDLSAESRIVPEDGEQQLPFLEPIPSDRVRGARDASGPVLEPSAESPPQSPPGLSSESAEQRDTLEESPAQRSPEAAPVAQLLAEQYYLQIGVYSNEQVARSIAAELRASEPNHPVLVRAVAGQQAFRILVGPIKGDERGAALFWIRAKGYPDAYARRGTEL